MSYMTLSSQEKHLFYSFHTFAHIRQHYFSKYWGDECMGRPTTSNFGENRPPIPPKFPPQYVGHLGGPNMRSPGHIVSVELPSIFGEVRHFGGLPSFVCHPSNCNTDLTVSVAYVRD